MLSSWDASCSLCLRSCSRSLLSFESTVLSLLSCSLSYAVPCWDRHVKLCKYVFFEQLLCIMLNEMKVVNVWEAEQTCCVIISMGSGQSCSIKGFPFGHVLVKLLLNTLTAKDMIRILHLCYVCWIKLPEVSILIFHLSFLSSTWEGREAIKITLVSGTWQELMFTAVELSLQWMGLQ